MMRQQTLAVFIPLKTLDRAKGRLRSALRPEERRGLVRHMFLHVVSAVRRAAVPTRVFVLAGDAAGVRLAERAGAVPLAEWGMWRLEWTDSGDLPPVIFPPERVETPLNRVLSDALAWAEEMGWQRALVLPADLPYLSPAEVEALWQRSRAMPLPHLVIAPDRQERGTNAFLSAPPTALPPLFGQGSFLRHVAWARMLGLHVQVVRSPGLAVDVDEVQDWEGMRRGGPIREHVEEWL